MFFGGIAYLNTLSRTIPYLNILSRTIPNFITLSRTKPYLKTFSRNIPYLNTLNRIHSDFALGSQSNSSFTSPEVSANQNWEMRHPRALGYCWRPLSALGLLNPILKHRLLHPPSDQLTTLPLWPLGHHRYSDRRYVTFAFSEWPDGGFVAAWIVECRRLCCRLRRFSRFSTGIIVSFRSQS